MASTDSPEIVEANASMIEAFEGPEAPENTEADETTEVELRTLGPCDESVHLL